MQVLDDTGKVLMNIVGGDYFSIEHTEKLVALSKKSRQRKLMRKNLRAHESDYTQAKHTKPEYV
jgi:hypothetical protein